MIELVYILLIIFIFYASYIVSLYSLAVYVDPDEVTRLYPNVTDSQRSLLEKMSGDPRTLVHIAEIFKSFSMIILTVIALSLLNELATALGVSVMVTSLLGLFFLWLLYGLLVELMPRNLSRHAINENMVRHLWLIYLIYLVFGPFSRLFKKIFKRKAVAQQVSEEEKEDIVERAIETVAERAGIDQTIVDEEEKEMINQIFLLDQTVVKEIMVPRMDIVAFEKNMNFNEIRAIIKKDGHSRYPVFDESIDKIIGLIYVKDLFNNMPDLGEKFDIQRYLRKPYLIPEKKIIGELLREFKEKRQHIALVVDEYGGVAGLVTLEDIIEEIFGEIQDEHDSEIDEIRQLRDGSVLVDAAALVEEMQDYFDTEYEQGDYESVGGLIYDLVGSVPEIGQRIKWFDYEFEIEDIEGQRIRYVKVYKKQGNGSA